MTGLVKGIGKVVKKVVNGVKKVYKKITSTTLGKVLLAGAAIYLGGGAFGWWDTPFKSINGAFVGGGSGGAATGNAVTAGTTSSEVAATGQAAATAAPASSGAIAGAARAAPAGIPSLTVTGTPMGASTGIGAAGTAAPSMLAPSTVAAESTAASTLAANTAAQAAPTGLISRLMKPVSKLATFAEEHPVAAAMTVNGLASAMSPNAVDVERMRIAQEEEDRRRWQENLSVGNVDLGFRPTYQPLQYTGGGNVYTPGTGAINRTRGS